MAVDKDGVETQTNQGNPGGIGGLGGAKEGDYILQQAVADLPPIRIRFAEDEGESAFADLGEVVQVHLVVHPHRGGPEDGHSEHGDGKKDNEDEIVPAGRVEFAKEKAQHRRCQGKD